jgi:uncharacterized protein (TIGR02611 family)
MENMRRHSKKVLIAIVGGVVVLAGLVMIPYPGPGWLTVFAGLAILATEFAFASKTLNYARGKYDLWLEWMKKQGWPVRLMIALFTVCVVVVTIWLVNGFGILGWLVKLDNEWIVSPFFRK